MPGPRGVPRTDIIALLREGHSDREIGRRLRTNPKRVGRAAAARLNTEAPPAFRLAGLPSARQVTSAQRGVSRAGGTTGPQSGRIIPSKAKRPGGLIPDRF